MLRQCARAVSLPAMHQRFSSQAFDAWKRYGYHDEDNEWRWSPSTVTTKFAQELLSLPAIEHKFGVQSIQLSESFGFYYDLTVLVTREHSRQLYSHIADTCTSNPGTKFLVEGLAGTGKTRNLVYLLQQLLRKGKQVVYRACSHGVVFAFVSSADKPTSYEVFRTALKDHVPERCALLQRADTVLLIDPPHSTYEPSDLPCSMVIAASLEVRHFSSYLKHSAPTILTMNPWTLPEASEFFRITGMPVAEEGLAARFFQAGGSIRNLQAAHWIWIGNIIARQDHALLSMNNPELVMAHRSIAGDDPTIDHKRLEALPAGIFVPVNTLHPADPDYSAGRERRPVSEGAVARIVAHVFSRQYGVLEDLLSGNRRAEARRQLEVVGKLALLHGGTFRVRELLPDMGKYAAESPESHLVLPPAAGRMMAAIDLRTVGEKMKSAEATERRVLWSVQRGRRGQIVVDAPLRCYLFAVAMTCSRLSHCEIEQLLNLAGATAEHPLCLYFCVPLQFYQEGFKRPQLLSATKDSAARLRQFVLHVPYELTKPVYISIPGVEGADGGCNV